MNCMNCGAFLLIRIWILSSFAGATYLIQKKVEYLSKLYYNQGLEKARYPGPFRSR